MVNEEQFIAVVGADLTEVEPSTSDCPLCPHPESEHGTYGCLADWRWEGEHLARGCPCARRRLIDHTRRNAVVFGLPFPRGTGG